MKIAVRVAALAVLTVALHAQPSPLRFRFERPVTPGAGANRLAIDVALLTGARPFVESQFARSGSRSVARGGLADLRLFDADGREVPYLLVPPPPAEPVWIRGEALPIATTEKTSGFEADFGVLGPLDRLRIEGIRAPFLKRAVLEGSGDREHWTMLVPEGTVFDLPAERMVHLDLEFRAGDYRYLRVTWDDTNSGRVAPPPVVRARSAARALAPAPALSADIPFERRPSEPGRSRFRLTLPGARLPIVRLDVDVDGPYVMRQATVTEARFDGRQVQPIRIGEATLKRVTRDGVQADELVIPVSMPERTEIELVVNDENNPPLALRKVTALFAELPAIYFESDGRPLVARYGDALAEAPRYDLEAARESVRIDAAAPAVWGTPVARVETETTPAPPMPSTGAPLDRAAFRHARDLPSGGAGLVALPLDAAVLAHSVGLGRNFADVRVLDASGHQVPYLVERRDEPLTLNLEFARREKPPSEASQDTRESWYTVRLPYEGLPAARLAVETPARIFQRSVALVHERPQDTRRRTPSLVTLATAEWINSASDAPAAPLVLDFSGITGRELLLEVDEGDNTALPVERVTLLLPSYRIRFFRPEASALTLVYGRDDLGPPQYDLALLAPQVLGAPATDIAAQPERESDRTTPGQLVNPVVFWAVLGMAIIALLGIIVRLVRSEPAQSG